MRVGKSTLRRVKLVGRHTQIEQDAVNRLDSQLVQHRAQF